LVSLTPGRGSWASASSRAKWPGPPASWRSFAPRRYCRNAASVCPLPLRETGSGRYGADAVFFPVTGNWQLRVYLRTNDIDSYKTGSADIASGNSPASALGSPIWAVDNQR
jgi:hypothetical protein